MQKGGKLITIKHHVFHAVSKISVSVGTSTPVTARMKWNRGLKTFELADLFASQTALLDHFDVTFS